MEKCQNPIGKGRALFLCHSVSFVLLFKRVTFILIEILIQLEGNIWTVLVPLRINSHYPNGFAHYEQKQTSCNHQDKMTLTATQQRHNVGLISICFQYYMSVRKVKYD